MNLARRESAVKIVGVRCDVCGADCVDDPHNVDSGRAKFVFGFGSSKDGTVEQIDFCAPCWERMADFVRASGGEVRTREHGAEDPFLDAP